MSDAPKPAVFPKPALYRVTRDTLYHTAGTILCLTPNLVSPLHHEHLVLTGADSDPAAIDRLDALEARIAALEASHA